MEISKNRIRFLFYLCTISIVTLLVFALNFMFLDAFNNQSNEQLEQLRTSILDMKKIYIKDIIDITIQNIEIEKEILYETEIESLDNTMDIILSVLAMESDHTHLINHIKDEHIINKHTEFLLYDISSNEVVYSANSKLETPLIQCKDDVIEAFEDHYITNHIETDQFLAIFGITESYIDQKVKAITKGRIERERFIDDGYIWINQIIDYGGGDDYAFRFVHPNLPETEGSYLSTNTEDIDGNKPYQTELDGINENGELFNEYYFKKMNVDTVAHKLSYAKLYKPYDWVIATGVYLDDVDTLIEMKSHDSYILQNQIKIRAFTITFLAILFSVAFIGFFERLIFKLIQQFQDTVNQQNTEIQAEKELIEKLAYSDSLTGILNRRAMIEKLEEAFYESTRYSESFSVAIADIDDFKKINDTYGHNSGDIVIKEIANMISTHIRENDAVARWGGEEFLVLLHHSDSIAARSKFDAIRSIIEDNVFSCEGQSVRCTVSIGFKSFNEECQSYNDLISTADSNLYDAKRSGKNKVIGS